MKIFKLVLLVLFVINLTFPQSALAGVMSKMVEVDSECRQELDAMRVELDEVKAANLSLTERINRLLGENEVLKAENKTLKDQNTQLTSQISTLKQNNTDLSYKIEELKSKVVTTQKVEPTPAPAPAVKAKKKSSKGDHHNVLWPIISTPVGAITGTVRGAMNKSVEYANGGSEILGPSLPGQLIGKLGGLLVGNITGAVTGLIKGIFDGVRLGYSKPYTAESISLANDYSTEWDPYDL